MLAARLLAHFVIFVALQHVAARAILVLIGNIGHKRRGIADARGNVSRGARRQALLQRQFHGAIYRDAHHAVVFVRPTVAVHKFVLLRAVGVQFGARFHLQARGGRQNARVLPPAPRLQVEPRAELHAYCEQQAKLLNTYGWADGHNGVVRIPVDRAMELTLQQGLPSRSAAEVPAGVSNPAPFVPDIADQDQTGPCGYVLERDKDQEMSQEVRH